MNATPRIIGAIGLGLVAATAVVAASTGTVTTAAADTATDAATGPPPATVTMVADGRLAQPERRVVVARIDLPPGGYVDWHRHPGRVTGVVTAGTLTVVDRVCHPDAVPAGGAFVPPRSAHTARNVSDAPASVVLTFVVRGERPTIYVGADVDDRLDQRCGLAE